MVVVLAALAAASILLLFCWLMIQAVRRDGPAPWLSSAPDPASGDVVDYGAASAEPPALSLAWRNIFDQERRWRAAEAEVRRLRLTHRDLKSAARAMLRAARGEVRACKTALSGSNSPQERRTGRADLREAVELKRAARTAVRRVSSMRSLESATALVTHVAEQEVRMWQNALKGGPRSASERGLRRAWREARQRRDSLQRTHAALQAVEQSRAALRQAVDQKNALQDRLYRQPTTPSFQAIAPRHPDQPDDAGSARRRDSMPALLRILALALPPKERQQQFHEWRADLWDLSHQGNGQWRRWRYAIAAATTVPRLAARRFQRTSKRPW
jgi:hypothetical protein